MQILTVAILALFAAATACGFLAVVSFIRAGYWPDRGGAADPQARLAVLLGLDLDGEARRHWSRGWTLTSGFLALWFLAVVLGALAAPALR